MAGKYVASFAGFAPVASPEIVCIVSIDEPTGAYYGGEVAAPVFAQAVSHALQILGVSPENSDESSFVAGGVKTFEVPQLVDDRPLPAPTPGPPAGAGEKASPEAPTQIAESASKASQAKEPQSKEPGKDAHQGSEEILVPDLSGRGIREAVALCASRGLKLQASGEGIVSGQSPPPGTYVTKEAVCRVKLAKVVQKKARSETEPKKPASSGGQIKAAAAKAK
jgi:stage V sporulation protein D (sporulation-specific penicillin-binding protein)